MARRKQAEETEFIPPNFEAARALKRALVGQGTTAAQARGIIGWLIELPEDTANDELRRVYRRELARLGTPPWRVRTRDSVAAVAGVGSNRAPHSYRHSGGSIESRLSAA